jgi:hypothetical protein
MSMSESYPACVADATSRQVYREENPSLTARDILAG